MPNWCNNTIEIEGTKEQINKFVSFLENLVEQLEQHLTK